MKLYHSGTSPYVRKVMMALHLTGLLDRVELIPGGGTPLTPNEGTTSANPIGKVPCLVTDDGQALFDSRVITRWLDAEGKGGLYPDGAALFPVLTIEALADGILDAALLVIYEARLRPEELRFEPWVEGQRAKILRGIAALEPMVDQHLGGSTTAAHIAVGSALGYVDFRMPAMDWRTSAPRLAAWYAEFAAQPFMRATEPSD